MRQRGAERLEKSWWSRGDDGAGSDAVSRRAGSGRSARLFAAVVADTSSKRRAAPSVGKMVLPPPSTIGSIIRFSSSTRSRLEQRPHELGAAHDVDVAARSLAQGGDRRIEVGAADQRRRRPREVGVGQRVGDDVLLDRVDPVGERIAGPRPARRRPSPATCAGRRASASVRLATSSMVEPMTSGSKNGIDQPPCWNPPSVSSSRPPGACTTPSRLMNSLMTIRMGSRRLHKPDRRCDQVSVTLFTMPYC